MDLKRDDGLTRPNGFLERTFALSAHGTTVRTELLAGLTTFLTMATSSSSIPTSWAMPDAEGGGVRRHLPRRGDRLAGDGVLRQLPDRARPRHGLNAYFAYVVVLQMGYTWQAALGAVFISACASWPSR